MEYELLFFTSVANEDKIESIKKDIAEILESLGGKLLSDFSDIGKRKLAYPIKRNTHAFYSFVRFLLEDKKKQNIPEIEKRLSLHGKIMRHLIVRADEIGSPVASLGKRIEEKKTGTKIRKTQEEIGTQKESTETKPKATLSELDDKLSEILEETPK